MESSTFRFP